MFLALVLAPTLVGMTIAAFVVLREGERSHHS